MRPLAILFALCSVLGESVQGGQSAKADGSSWTFVFSGDSRNCGDLIMPVIARQARSAGARFYWHLGDLRALFKADEDYAGLHRNNPDELTMDAYTKAAWDDFQTRQVAPFEGMPFFLGIGNHELIGRKRDDFVARFQSLLNTDRIRLQREADNPNDKAVHTYYHWREAGVDFINFDNAESVFDDAQVAWAMKVLAADESNSDVRIVIVGMHESLPDSYSQDHSMNQGADNGASGRAIYTRLLQLRQRSGKPVYVFSSHSHYYLANIYNTSAWQSHGGVLPGWLVGTAGAQHYSVPPEVKTFTEWAENEYGYALVRVTPDTGALDVQFVPVKRSDIVPGRVNEFGPAAVDFCFSQNWRATLHADAY